MTDQEKINENLQRQIDAQTSRIDNVLTKVDTIIGEMRDRDNQRAAEIIELRQKQEADMKEIRLSIDGMGKHVRNLSVATIIGVATIAVTVVYSILTH